MSFSSTPRPFLRFSLLLALPCLLALVLFWQSASPQTQTKSEQPRFSQKPQGATQPAALLSAAPVASGDSVEHFNAWLSSYVGGAKPSLEQGLALAKQRREELHRLITQDPARALSESYSTEFIRTLPSEMQALMEKQIDATVPLMVFARCDEHESSPVRSVSIDGQAYRVHASSGRPALRSVSHFPLNGIAIDGDIALQESPYRRIPSSSAANTNSGESAVQVLAGGEYMAFASEGELTSWSSQELIAEQALTADGAPAADPAWVFGEKRLLWILVDFSDSQGAPASSNDIQKMVDEASAFFTRMSHGKSSLKLTLHPKIFRSSYLKSQVSTSDLFAQGLNIMDQIVADAKAYDTANGGNGLYNPDNYDRWVVHYRLDGTTRAFASVGKKGMTFRGPPLASRLTHELGHNLGLPHANSWKPSTQNPIGAGVEEEYGDIFDNMGYGDINMPFNCATKFPLGFLAANELAVVKAPWLDETAPWEQTVRIYRSDIQQTGFIQSARVMATNGSNLAYWVDYLPQTSSTQNGVQLRWYPSPPGVPNATGGLPYATGTHLLDMTPQTSGGMSDATLQVGKAFTDVPLGVKITALSKGGTTNAEYVDAKISFGATGTNHNPQVTLSGDTPLKIRTRYTFKAAGQDSDGDPLSYRWLLNDQPLSDASSQLSTAWLSGGSCKLQVQALDGKGGVGFKTLSFQIEDPLLSWTQLSPALGYQVQDYTDVLYADGKFVVTGSWGALLYSVNGSTWKKAQVPSKLSISGLNGAFYDGSNYWAIGYQYLNGKSAPLLLRSSDAVTWLEVPTGQTSGVLTDMCKGPDGWVCVGWNDLILFSADGTTWKQVNTLTRETLYAVNYHNGLYLAVGSNAMTLSSTNGQNWVSRPFVSMTHFHAVFFQKGLWYVTDRFRETWTSADSVTWTKRIGTADDTFTGSIQDSEGFYYNLTDSSSLRIFGPDGLQSVVAMPGSKTPVALAQGNGLFVLVGTGSTLFKAGTPDYDPVPPEFTRQPISVATSLGRSSILFATVKSALPVTYSWSKDGVVIPGATGPSLKISSVAAGDLGVYVLSATNELGTTKSSPVRLMLSKARLTNLSVRSSAGSATKPLIIGYSIANGEKRLLTRAIGPTLREYGIGNPLPNPVMDVYTGTSVMASNDNWFAQDFATLKPLFASLGAFALPDDSLDAAIVSKISGVHTVWFYDKQDKPGIGLLELYDADARDSAATLVNVSALNTVTEGEGNLIAGFVVEGTSEITLLIRGIGPGLLEHKVEGVLVDPVLEIHTLDAQNRDQIIASNDDWNSDGRAAELSEVFNSVYAFNLSNQAGKDAALVITLAPGIYTAVLKSKGTESGKALVEVYVVP